VTGHQIDEEWRQKIVAGMADWNRDECPACGEPVGPDNPLPEHLEDGCPEL